MLIPEALSNLFMPFLHRCLDAAKQACKAINELDELLETGFRGSEVNIVKEMIVTLDEIDIKNIQHISNCQRLPGLKWRHSASAQYT